jgi:phosphatidylethanolamine-binding protein (PEBP) family uncharacterized protein
LKRLSLSTLLALAAGACQAAPGLVAFQLPETKTSGRLIIRTDAFRPGGTIPFAFSAYGANRIPSIRWKSLPAGTKSVVLLVEDPDAPTATPFIHWLRVSHDGGKHWIEGVNSTGETGWFGPRPPAGPAHAYHFQVFAVGKSLHGVPVNRSDLLAAMRGKVLTKGQVVGIFAKP